MSTIDLAPDASPVRVVGAGARTQWRSFVFAVLGATGYGVLTVLQATVIGHLVSTVVTPAVRDRHLSGAAAWQIIWQLGGVVVLNVLAVIVRRIAAGITYNNLIASTRRDVTRAYQVLPMRWHQAHPAGRLLSHANSDAETTWSIFNPLPMALGVVVMLLFGFVSIFLVDVPLGLVALVIFPLLIAINIWFQRVMRTRVQASQAARATVSTVADESFDGAVVVKALGRADTESRRFEGAAHQLRDANIRLGRTEGIFDPLTNALPTVGTLLVLLVGAHRVQAGQLNAGDVVQVAYLFNLLAWPVRAFGWILYGLPQVAIGWQRIKPILDDAVRLTPAPRRETLGAGPLPVSMRGVSFSYLNAPVDAGGSLRSDQVALSLGPRAPALETPTVPSEPAIENIDLDIPAGRSVAVVGPTGSGKSTLALVLTGLLEPTAGSVRIDGVDVLAAANREERVALATQEAFVFNESSLENVALGRHGVTRPDVTAALDVAHAGAFVEALPGGLDEGLGERGSRLSGGQRQRIALARVVSGKPGLVVLDDATSAIDPAVEGEILGSLREATSGCTTVIVAHRKSSIMLADSVVLMDGGRIVATGTHDDLMATQPAYRQLLTAYDSEATDGIDSDEDSGSAESGHGAEDDNR